MGGDVSFSKTFHALTGFDPMPWQKALYERFIGGGQGQQSGVVQSADGAGQNLGDRNLADRLGGPVEEDAAATCRHIVVDQTTDQTEKMQQNG